MLQKTRYQVPGTTDPVHVTRRGLEILNDPRLNKGTSFTPEEREALGLKGLLPPYKADMEEQVQRILAALRIRYPPWAGNTRMAVSPKSDIRSL